MKRFINTRTSTMFGHPVYPLDGPGPSIVSSGPHENFFNSALALWIDEKINLMDAVKKLGCTKYGGP